MIQPEEQRENKDMQNLNPQITKTSIGVRNLREITLYPLSIGDQMGMTSLLAKTVAGFYATQDSKDEVAIIGFFVSVINENLAKFLSLAVCEKETEGGFPETRAILNDLTNLQASEIANIIYKMNYEESIKNLQNLFGKVKSLFPSERLLPEFARDMDTGLTESLDDLSKKEDLQEDS